MTEWDAFAQKLEEVISRIERLSVEQKVVGPKRDREVEDLLKEAQEVFDELRAWQRGRENQDRFTQLLEAIVGSTAAAHDRLTISEGRLEIIEKGSEDRDRLAPEVQEVIREGFFLKRELRGLPTPDVEPKYFKDAGPRKDAEGREIEPGLVLLGSAVRAPTSTRAATKSASQTT